MVLIKFDIIGKFAHLPIDAHSSKPFSHQTAQQFHMGALLAAHHRRQQLVAGALGQGVDLVHHLIDGLGANRAVTLGAMGFTGSAIKKPQVVLNLRHRADGGAGVMAGGFLINRNGW